MLIIFHTTWFFVFSLYGAFPRNYVDVVQLTDARNVLGVRTLRRLTTDGFGDLLAPSQTMLAGIAEPPATVTASSLSSTSTSSMMSTHKTKETCVWFLLLLLKLEVVLTLGILSLFCLVNARSV